MQCNGGFYSIAFEIQPGGLQRSRVTNVTRLQKLAKVYNSRRDGRRTLAVNKTASMDQDHFLQEEAYPEEHQLHEDDIREEEEEEEIFLCQLFGEQVTAHIFPLWKFSEKA